MLAKLSLASGLCFVRDASCLVTAVRLLSMFVIFYVRLGSASVGRSCCFSSDFTVTGRGGVRRNSFKLKVQKVP